MGYLIFIALSIALLAGFVALTAYESRRGARFLADRRERLDLFVDRIAFVYEHVDFASFLKDETRHFAGRTGHAIAEHTLLAVRAAERSLTRAVRYLRTRHALDMQPRENAREFVKTLSEFKGQLQATRPEVPSIQ